MAEHRAFNTHRATLLPLLSTTATASLALYEYIFLSGLLRASENQAHRSSVARAISLWWQRSLAPGLALVVTFGVTSLATGIRAARALPKGSRERLVAIAGTVLALGHFAFAPKIATVIAGMMRAYERAGLWAAAAAVEERGKTEEEVADDVVLDGQRAWLTVHTWRTFLTDVPALCCFAWLALSR